MKKAIMAILTLMATIFVISSCTKTNNAIDPKNMDLSVKPGEDFFVYASGTWLKNTPIPDDQTRWGAFDILADENKTQLKTIIEESVSDTKAPKGSITQKIRDFYLSGMDTTRIEKEGIEPILDEFKRIEKINNSKELQEVIAHFHNIGISSLFWKWGYADPKNSQLVILQIGQGGLGLPDRDYYTDPRYKELLDSYKKHVATMFTLLNEPEKSAQNISKKIVAFEKRLAEASMTRLERRDPNKVYHKMSLKKLQKISPNFNWQKYFNKNNLQNPGEINIHQPVFIKEVSNMLVDVSLNDWKLYLRWKLISNTANYLNSAFVKQNFEFFGKTMRGSKKMKPRWKRVLGATNGALGEAVGQRYVKKYFPPEAKKRMKALVANLKETLGERINALEWMSSETKEKALAKLGTMTLKIGYPDKWKDYSNLEIKSDSYVLNALRADKFSIEENRNKIGKPVDKSEWGMTPQTVNAYYNPSNNEIVFPAAILQPPFFFFNGDDAVNYGAIGMVIGHEMTHGFDDQGRQYDKDGNLKDWWTKEDADKYKERTKIIVDQYNNFTLLDSMHVDGELTLGENIADIGGLKIAYESLQKAFKQNGKAKPINGFTQEQRFFLSLAQVWRLNIRDKAQLRLLKLDVHSPGKARVNVPVSNMPEFYKAFSVKEGEALFRTPEQRAEIW